MKVSLNIIKQLVGFDLPPVDELVKVINQQLGGVEEIINLGEKYKDALIVKVVSAEKHPSADKLSVCLVDDGSVCENIQRDEHGYVQVVCGAPNVHTDMWAVWLPPRSVVPSSFNGEQFVLDSRQLRGIMSHGMLAAGDELAINSDHNGIIEITEHDLPVQEPTADSLALKPGVGFAEIFRLNDTIVDIENKMFTHRPDCFGQIGVAREIAGILKSKFDDPKWYVEPTVAGDQPTTLELEVFNDAPDKVPRFMAVAIDNIRVAPSPLWLQCELVRLGGKAINNVVDITNYMMLMTAQPLHAYDYDKLRGRKLGVRMGERGESLPLLNDKTYEVDADDIVIVDGEGPIGMGGIMGGGNSEVSSDTRRIVLECATFDMYTIRKTSMRYGLFTDAVTRFNKGQSMLQQGTVLAQTMRMMCDVASGSRASNVFDEKLEPTDKRVELELSPEFINQRLGLKLTASDIQSLLSNVGFDISTHDSGLLALTSPFWRTDIHYPEDIVEEVGRLYGFDKLPRELPQRKMTPPAKNAMRELKQTIRESLRRAGANEVLTYSFVHENVLKRAGQDVNKAYRLSNALSPDLQYYRLSVLPSLLDKVHANIKAGHDEFALYEIGKGHDKRRLDVDGLPSELEYVDGIYANKETTDKSVYYTARRIVDELVRDLGIVLKFKPITGPIDEPYAAPFEMSRSAKVYSANDEFIGIVGEIKQSVAKRFKLPQTTAAFSLNLSNLQKAAARPRQIYTPLSKYPSVTQDISLRVASDTLYEDVFCVVQDTLLPDGGQLEGHVLPLSIYQAAEDTSHKTITLRVKVAHSDRTLETDEVSNLLDIAATKAAENFTAERV